MGSLQHLLLAGLCVVAIVTADGYHGSGREGGGSEEYLGSMGRMPWSFEGEDIAEEGIGRRGRVEAWIGAYRASVEAIACLTKTEATGCKGRPDHLEESSCTMEIYTFGYHYGHIYLRISLLHITN